MYFEVSAGKKALVILVIIFIGANIKMVESINIDENCKEWNT